jgi:hypothetical protein
MTSTNKSRRFPFGWIIFLLVLVLLFATNPSENQFNTYLKNELTEQAEGDETLAGTLKKLLAGPAASIAGLSTVRTDYYLCSTYKISILGEEQLFLGILDHFFKID